MKQTGFICGFMVVKKHALEFLKTSVYVLLDMTEETPWSLQCQC